MKTLFLFLLCNIWVYSQTINLKACPNLFDNTLYVFNKVSTDATGRNVYQTTPIDGAQECGGLGICEFQMAWHTTNNRWELIADDGNGTFGNSFLIYFNTSASLPNPPSLNLGVWQENNAITMGTCGGSLTSGNAILTGAVQDTTLGTNDISNNKFILLSNPVKHELELLSSSTETIYLFDYQGRWVKTITIKRGQNSINISDISAGIYILKTSVGNIKIIKN